MSENDLKRYSRQIDAVGAEGQERLKNARVLIAGGGGLGTIVATYLTAAGIGTLRIVDCDTIEISNLNRQILHWDKDIGRKKTDSIAEKLHAMNPLTAVENIHQLIDENSINDLVAGADIIVDAMDNFKTRYVLNQAALSFAIPFVHGAISGFYGQVTTIIPGRTACLSCIFPQGPPRTIFPAVGATCGVIGSIQATEVIKHIAQKGDLLAGRLLFWDGLACEMNIIRVEKNRNCKYCSSLGSI